jgi:ATP-dependent helicase HepA
MAKGALVTVVDLQSEGLARLVEERGGYMVIKFLASGAQMTQESRLVLRYVLLPGTRVKVLVPGASEPIQAEIAASPLGRDTASGLLVYGIVCEAETTHVREDAIVGIPAPRDPIEQLVTASFNDLRPQFAKAGSAMPSEPWGPNTISAREKLLSWRDTAWSNTGGVVGLAAARVQPLPHQLLAAQRMLADRHVRFLLADEVGLGKTIEAGLVIQSLLAIKPTLRVLIVVPGALISQWFLELFVRFGGRRFLMLDAERIKSYAGNPWADEQFVIASSRAIESLGGKDALRLATSSWDVLVVDECHRMQPGGMLYKRIAVLSKATPHVLLLSATPARQHADAYLALLALLQPQVWRTDDLAGFEARFAAHDRVVELMQRTVDSTAADHPALCDAWLAVMPGDTILAGHVKALRTDPGALELLLAYVREYVQLDRRLIRNRRNVLARLATATGIRAFDPTTRSRVMVNYSADRYEEAVRAALQHYRTTLVAAAKKGAGAKKSLPPRLMHWLLQVELAVATHPAVTDRLLAMRATVLEDPGEFAEYRDQAGTSETLEQVLRSDLSEHEIATHVAISASCHCDPAVETQALATLRTANDAWLKQAAKKPTMRLQSLIAAIEAFWEEHPDEKLLIFTTHALAIEPLALALGKAVGEKRVETFGAHQDTVAREESARRFAQDNHCAIMVSDPLGGEGRNFQFVSVVVHHDMPWSLAAVEQRIGRVDRLGRDGDIPSWVMSCDHADAIDSAWSQVLDQAVGVFSASSSGLEFIADDVETTALTAALTKGAPGILKELDGMKALVARERAARDAQADDVFAANTAAYIAAGELSTAVSGTEIPVGSVARWIRSMGGSAKRKEEHPQPWSMRTRYNDEPEVGVFSRDSALAHPHLSYFGIGHGLIDRLVADASSSTWCAAMAWRRKAPDAGAWSGIRAIYSFALDLAPLAVANVRLEVLRRLFVVAPPMRRVICVRAQDGQIETKAVVLNALKEPFDAKAGDLTASSGVNRDAWARPLLAGQPEKITGWQQQIRRACTSGQQHVDLELVSERVRLRAILDAHLLPGLAAAHACAAATRHQFGDKHPDTKQAQLEADEEARQVAALQAAIDGAIWSLDHVSYVSLMA